MARRKAAAVEPEEVLEDVDELDDLDTEDEDLDELEDDEPAEEETPAPAKRGKKAAPAKTAKAAPAKEEGSGNDSNWLAGHVNELLGTEYDARSIRMVLRRMANDGELAREVGVDRVRYDFPKGAADPIVKKLVARIKGGAVKQARDEGLAQAKATRAAKTAPAKTAPAKTGPAKKTSKAAPAKAAPTRRRRAE